jgi:hypothetical protein
LPVDVVFERAKRLALGERQPLRGALGLGCERSDERLRLGPRDAAAAPGLGESWELPSRSRA